MKTWIPPVEVLIVEDCAVFWLERKMDSVGSDEETFQNFYFVQINKNCILLIITCALVLRNSMYWVGNSGRYFSLWSIWNCQKVSFIGACSLKCNKEGCSLINASHTKRLFHIHVLPPPSPGTIDAVSHRQVFVHLCHQAFEESFFHNKKSWLFHK